MADVDDALFKARKLVQNAQVERDLPGGLDRSKRMEDLMIADTLAQIDMAESLRTLAYMLPTEIRNAITEGIWNARPHKT